MNKANIAQQPKTASLLSPYQGILQRKCSCGSHTPADKECTECAKKKSALQRKLTIGASNDPLELEADRVADQVLARQPGPIVSNAPPHIQRYAGHAAEQADASVPPSVHQTLADPGRPLALSLQQDMGQRFGHDFSSVRVHTNAKATESAKSVSALAYTVGRNIVFQSDHYKPELTEGKRLLAHELTHVVQQTGGAPIPTKSSKKASSASNKGNYRISHIGQSSVDVIQRAGDPAFLPTPFACPHDLTPGRPAGTDVLFSVGGFAITPAHTLQLTTVRDSWRTAGGTEDVLVHGYASTQGDQEPNWVLSCNRAASVKTELVRLGIPAVRVNVVAHGESTDFSASNAPNQHAVVSTSPGGILPLPLATGVLTPQDNFTSRSLTRFGVGEVVDLSFLSFPPRPAVDFGGLEWHLAAGAGVLTGVTNTGTATYTAPAVADPSVRLELRVATGATAGRVISAHAIRIVIPNDVRLVAVAGSFPNFGGWGNPTVPAGTWGAGFQGNQFILPRDISFRGIVFSEGTATSVVTGSFQSRWAGLVHGANAQGTGQGGTATGTPLAGVGPDGVSTGTIVPGSVLGIPFCGTSTFTWPIPWQFSVSGGPVTPFKTVNHLQRSTPLCNAIINKAGANFCRAIDGTVC